MKQKYTGVADEIERLRADNERLRAALKKIIDDAESGDGATAWDGADIARAALSASEVRA